MKKHGWNCRTKERKKAFPLFGELRALVSGLSLLFIVFAYGCDDEQPPPQLSPLGPHALILAFGDSLTYGIGAPRDKSYPAVLETSIGRRVINAGKPGETTSEGLKRLPEVLDAAPPDLLLLIHGGNDILQRLSFKTAKENLKSMVLEARKRGVEVVLFGVPVPSLSKPKGADFYEELAREMKLPYEGEILAEVLGDGNLKNDLVHPNATGYALMATKISLFLSNRGAL